LAEVDSLEDHLPFVRQCNWWVMVLTEILLWGRLFPHDEQLKLHENRTFSISKILSIFP